MRRLTLSAVLALLLLNLSFAGPRVVAAPTEPKAPQGVAYPLPDGVRFLHISSNFEISGATSDINNPAADNDPTDLIFATHNWNPGGEGGMFNNRNVGVEYDPDVLGLSPAGFPGNWLLFNEDYAAFLEGLAYNIMVTPAGERAFIHTTSIGNLVSGLTEIDDPWLNGHPDRIPFIMHNLTPNGVDEGALAYTRTVGIYYELAFERWFITNEDETNLPTGVSFNVMVGLPGGNVFTHTATVTNTVLNWTYIDHPLANGNPNAVILVTQDPAPDPTGSLVYNNHPVGVYYEGKTQQWAIYNDDSAVMPIGAGFSVLIDEADLYLPLVLR